MSEVAQRRDEDKWLKRGRITGFVGGATVVMGLAIGLESTDAEQTVSHNNEQPAVTIESRSDTEDANLLGIAAVLVVPVSLSTGMSGGIIAERLAMRHNDRLAQDPHEPYW